MMNEPIRQKENDSVIHIILLMMVLLCIPLISSALPIPIALPVPDTDRDGFPDEAELIDEADRTNFRRWFVAIAESQFYSSHPRWPKIRRDCAGLICFAYKEALKSHKPGWFKGFQYLTQSSIPDIKAYQYPSVPHISTNLFRTRSGMFREADLEKNAGVFQPVATARVLMETNCRAVGKELNETLKAGDLLFFRYTPKDSLEDRYHAMILVKVPKPGSTDGNGVVVYHTGPAGNGMSTGEVRRVSIDDLNRHPDDIWHVKPGNPHFMGFYRFHILDFLGIGE